MTDDEKVQAARAIVTDLNNLTAERGSIRYTLTMARSADALKDLLSVIDKRGQEPVVEFKQNYQALVSGQLDYNRMYLWRPVQGSFRVGLYQRIPQEGE